MKFLEELEQELKSITPGEWFVDAHNPPQDVRTMIDGELVLVCDFPVLGDSTKDANFIAKSPARIEKLCRALRVMSNALEELQLDHAHNVFNSEYRPMSDYYGFCGECRTKVALNSIGEASEALSEVEKILNTNNGEK